LLIECLDKLNRKDEYLEIMLEHISKNKYSYKIKTKLGLYYLHKNNHVKAFETLQAACDINNTYFNSFMTMGSIIQENTDYDLAISKYKIIINDFPNSPELWNNIGLCF